MNNGFTTPVVNMSGMPDGDMRLLFISKMREFANSVDSAPSKELAISFIQPYLSMANMDGMVPNLTADNLVASLREAANEVEKDSSANAVTFAYYGNGAVNVVMMNFIDGQVASKILPFSKGDTLAEELFFDVFVQNALEEAVSEFGAVPLPKASAAFCAA